MRRRVRLATLLATVALSAGAAGCGDDNEDEGVSIPSIAIPDEGAPATTTTAPPPATTGTVPESGGAAPEQQGGSGAQDGDAGATPQERFEQFCKQNPGACGD